MHEGVPGILVLVRWTVSFGCTALSVYHVGPLPLATRGVATRGPKPFPPPPRPVALHPVSRPPPSIKYLQAIHPEPKEARQAKRGKRRGPSPCSTATNTRETPLAAHQPFARHAQAPCPSHSGRPSCWSHWRAPASSALNSKPLDRGHCRPGHALWPAGWGAGIRPQRASPHPPSVPGWPFTSFHPIPVTTSCVTVEGNLGAG